MTSSSSSSPDFSNPDDFAFREIFSCTQDGITMTDENGIVMLWNPAMVSITGIPAEEALGKPIWEIQYRLSLPKNQTQGYYDQLKDQALAGLRTGKMPAQTFFEHQFRHIAGIYRVVQVSLFPIPTAKGFRAASILRDVTLQQQEKDRLRTLSRVVEQSPSMVIITDPDGHIQYVNPIFTEVTGYTLEEAKGQTPRIIKSGLTNSEVYTEMWARLKRGETWSGELQNRRKNGERYWVKSTISPVRNDQGEISHLVDVQEDVTIRKEAEEQLRFQASLLENVSDAVYSLNVDMQIVSWNRAAERMYGWSPQEVIGKNTAEILQSTYEGISREDVRASLLREGRWEGEGKYIARDGHVVYALTSASTIRDRVGNPVAFVIIQHDITERKRVDEALRASEERFRMLVNSMDDVVFTLDTNQRYTSIYGRTLAIYRTPASELLGKTATELFGELQAEAHRAASERALSGESLMYEWTMLDRVILSSLSPLRDSNGVITGVVGVGRDITRLKETERALAKNEAMLLAILDHAPMIISLKDLSGEVLLINQRAQVLDTPPLQTLVGTTAFDVFPEDVAQRLWQSDRVAIRTRKPVELEETFRHKDGSYHTYWMIRFPIMNSQQEVTGVCAIWTDITQRKDDEHVIQEANREFLALNRIISTAATALDPATVLNVACNELSDLFQVQVVAGSLVDDAQRYASIVAECALSSGGSVLGLQFSLVDNPLFDALQRYKVPIQITDAATDVRVNALRHLLSGVNPASLLVIPVLSYTQVIALLVVASGQRRAFSDEEISLATNIAQAIAQPLENSKLHRALSEQNQQLEQMVHDRTKQFERLNQRTTTILNSTSDAIVLAWDDGRIANTNLAFNRMFGYTEDEVFKQPMTVLIDEADQRRLMDAMRQTSVLLNKRLQLSARTKTGKVFDADIALALVRQNGGHIVCSIRDITNLKEIERAKDRFISMVSHELRTPTTSIIVSAETLSKHYARMTDDQRIRALNRVREQAHVMAELIEGILDLSRVDMRATLNLEAEVDVTQITEQSVTEFQESAEQRNLRIALEKPATAVQITGDENDIARIWRNLIGNAVKYTGDGGRITVRLSRLKVESNSVRMFEAGPQIDPEHLPTALAPGSYVVGQVEDTGRGIPEKDLAQLFGRFFRGWAAQSNIPGTGLGLAFVRELLNIYGGSIVVRSQLNVGSIFTFWLPVKGIGPQ